ncbi:MAG: hypothetical protein K8S00_12165 [Bacteroidales bacterium]|nr:hypothetical protein [Bacteroidales bacterium]
MKKLVSLLFFMLICTLASASFYYLSYNGSDSNDGLSSTKPFQTFTQAASVMAPGDHLVCDGNGGLYFADTISCVFTRSGTAGSLIHILGINGFTLTTNTVQLTYIDLSSSNYLVFDNIKINTRVYTDSLYVKIGHSTSGTPKYYYIQNCFFSEGSCIYDAHSDANYYPNLFINECCFAEGSVYAIRVNNDLSSSYSALNINHCTFYSTEPVYILNAGSIAYNFYFHNSIVHSCTNIIYLAEGTLSSPSHSHNILYNYTDYVNIQVIALDATELVADPMFNNTNVYDLYLKVRSPAINFYNRSYCGALPRLAILTGGL